MGHRLVARRLGAQLAKGEGFALGLISKSTHLAPERFDCFGADRARAGTGSAFQFHSRRCVRALPNLMREVRDLNRDAGKGLAVAQAQRCGRPERLLPLFQCRRKTKELYV